MLDIIGSAVANATVTVNAQPAQRSGRYFYKGVSVDNSTAPQFSDITITAVKNIPGNDLLGTSTGKLYLPKTPEIFTHDAEGNLASDGRWNNTWDGENRLIQQETLATVPAAAKLCIRNTFDSKNRRIRKQVDHWTGTAWAETYDHRFLYDGWNQIAELDSSNAILQSFTWGLDLSGTLQGAGGVGALLAIKQGGESYLPTYDGNGNITALIKSSDRTTAARYAYGPFGEILEALETGISNPFRFSTKYQERETGFYYYINRFYNPNTGRWLSKDMIGERGGVNLYGFLINDGVNQWDYLGFKLDGPCKCKVDLGNYKDISFEMETTSLLDTYSVQDPVGAIKTGLKSAIDVLDGATNSVTKNSPWKFLSAAVSKFASSFSNYSKALNALHEAQSEFTITSISVNVSFKVCKEVGSKFEFSDDTGFGNWSDGTGLSFADEGQRKMIPGAYMDALKMAAEDIVKKINLAKGK